MAAVMLVDEVLGLGLQLKSAVDYINNVRHYPEEFAGLKKSVQSLERVFSSLHGPIDQLQNTPDFSSTDSAGSIPRMSL